MPSIAGKQKTEMGKMLIITVLAICVPACAAREGGGVTAEKPVPNLQATLDRLDDGQMALRIATNPWHVVGLTSHPDSLEIQLKDGMWLVMVYSPHNVQHVRLALGASEIANQLAGECRLAIRPSHGFEDLRSWVGDKDVAERPLEFGVPLWLLYHDGKLIARRGGQISPELVVEFVRSNTSAR